MCTLIVLDRIVPGHPLVVASNRDEFYARPAAPPARVEPRREGQPPFVAPQDLEGGGAWMGVNAAGLFVGLTNRATARRNDRARSRGLLVLDALARTGAKAVAEDMGASLIGHYNPFHLLAADGRTTHLTVVSEDAAETRTLGPGAHVVCNRDPGDASSGKVAWIRGALAEIDPHQPLPKLATALMALLGRHPNPSNPLENPCVHTPEYGTRSATVLALGERRWRWWQAEGAPCETKFGNLSRLLDDLREASSHHVDT